MNERLSAHFTVQVGDEQWGNKNYNEREINLRTLYAYLQFRPEFLGDHTSFRVGLQGYDDVFQYSIWSDEAVGLIINHATDRFNANIGYLSLRDDDVDSDVDFAPDAEGLFTASETLYLFDMNYQFTDALNIKAAFYYDDMHNLPAWQPMDYRSRVAFYGLGADYMMNDALSFGGNFVMRSGSNTVVEEGEELAKFEQKGYFAYLYSSYTMNKFSAKVNFGYTPANIESNADGLEVTNWSGAFALLSSDPMMIIYGIGGGNQWQTAYGLEYFGRGDVCDRQAVNSGYGGIFGLMVVSANISYDFLYANFGIMRATADEDFVGDDFEYSFGSELDLGIRTDIIENLEFKAVYAMFFTGDFYSYSGEKLDNAHEMSMQLRYAF